MIFPAHSDRFLREKSRNQPGNTRKAEAVFRAGSCRTGDAIAHTFPANGNRPEIERIPPKKHKEPTGTAQQIDPIRAEPHRKQLETLREYTVSATINSKANTQNYSIKYEKDPFETFVISYPNGYEKYIDNHVTVAKRSF